MCLYDISCLIIKKRRQWGLLVVCLSETVKVIKKQENREKYTFLDRNGTSYQNGTYFLANSDFNIHSALLLLTYFYKMHSSLFHFHNDFPNCLSLLYKSRDFSYNKNDKWKQSSFYFFCVCVCYRHKNVNLCHQLIQVTLIVSYERFID